MSTIDWYLSVSRDRGVAPRCPFATVHRCPRFYLSTWVLNAVNKQPQDEALHGRWQRSKLYPSREDEFPRAAGNPNALHYGAFCPEIAYERFHRFASELTEYFDEDERRSGQVAAESGGPEWKSEWLTLTARHFTECPLYSVLLELPEPLQAADLPSQNALTILQEPAPVFVMKPTLWGMSVDLQQIWRRGRKWLLEKRGPIS